MLNAGKVPDRYEATDDKLFEWMFGTMHIAHFYLTHLVADRLRSTAAATGDVCVVVVSSLAHVVPPPKPIWSDSLYNASTPAWEFPEDYLSFGARILWKRCK